MVAKFWWNGGEEGRKIHWKAWGKLIDAKKEGGMGFREFEATNEALLAKNCMEDLKTVQMSYGLKYPMVFISLTLASLRQKKGGRALWLWTSILDGRNMLMDDLYWKIGNGYDVRQERQVDKDFEVA
ncbi:uncharacterized protein LOC114752287 [Neltuma alba]|uniref:uncharacterized protein LOC114752287 n=1 Tax=Neltuma alba TaxID=207710 RepID=UPI0010A32B43|nr:uncharacterized protein LOC114752287 [Prosopis alba]